MFQIDSNGSVAGMFSEGDPSTGTPGTKISADWLNAVQQEIVNLLTAMGVPLDKANSGQLAAAAVAAATANLLVRRDVNGRAQFADPASAQDAATMAYVKSLAPVLSMRVRGSDGAIVAQKGSIAATAGTKATGNYQLNIPGLTSNCMMQVTSNGPSDVNVAAYLSGSVVIVNSRLSSTDGYTDQDFTLTVHAL